MHIYRQRAAQNGRLLVVFFVTKYRDLFCDRWEGRGGGGGSLPDSPRPLSPSLPRTVEANDRSTIVAGEKEMIFSKVVPRPFGMLKQVVSPIVSP